MSALIRSILLVLGLLSGCATAPPMASADAPLAEAKSRSTTYCAKYQNGCELRAVRIIHGGWSVKVSPIIRGADGSRALGLDLDRYYLYDAKGQFFSALGD